MAVKLYSFPYTGIHPGHCEIRDFFDSYKGADGQLMVELIHHGNALYLQEITSLKTAFDFIQLLCSYKQFYT